MFVSRYSEELFQDRLETLQRVLQKALQIGMYFEF
jgi:hypothetical protein